MRANRFTAVFPILTLSMLSVACAGSETNGYEPNGLSSAEVYSGMAAAHRAAENASLVASRAAAEKRTKELPHHCNDLVIVGIVHSIDYRDQETDGDFLGHGWISAIVDVSRFISGDDRRPKLQARYFGHTYLRDNKDFVLVLHPNGAGTYVIEQAIGADGRRPRLSLECEGSPTEADEFRRG